MSGRWRSGTVVENVRRIENGWIVRHADNFPPVEEFSSTLAGVVLIFIERSGLYWDRHHESADRIRSNLRAAITKALECEEAGDER